MREVNGNMLVVGRRSPAISVVGCPTPFQLEQTDWNSPNHLVKFLSPSSLLLDFIHLPN